MKRTLAIVLCFAVVLATFAIGFSAFAGADSLSVVSGPTKMYYLDKADKIDVTGTKLGVKIGGEEQVIELTKNIESSGSVEDAMPTTTTTEATTAETTTAEADTTTTTTTTVAARAAEEKTEKADASKVKVYYDYPLKDGKNEVVFKYEDKTATCEVYVDADPVKSVVVTKAPTKKDYFYGYDNDKDVDLSGLEITVTFNKCGGEKEQTFVYKYDDVKSLSFMGHKFSMYFAYQLKIGENPVIVTYLGKESKFILNYQEVIIGDVNDDGKVNAADLVRLSRIVINDEKLPYNSLTTDIETDGKINSKDLKALRQILTMPDDKGEFDWVFDAQLLSYMVSKDGYFYTNNDPWQRNFGFNALYDYATPYTFMYYDTFRVFFDYGTYEDGTTKQWMIQPWKGQYGMVLYGAELGVYTKPETRVTPHYDCAADEDLLGMQMTVYKDEKEAFTMPYDMYWWITGFKLGALDNYTDMSKPHSQLIIKFTVDFPANEMARLFAEGLEERGFSRVGFLDTKNFSKVDVYTIEQNRVVFLWRDIVGSDQGTNIPNN